MIVCRSTFVTAITLLLNSAINRSLGAMCYYCSMDSDCRVNSSTSDVEIEDCSGSYSKCATFFKVDGRINYRGCSYSDGKYGCRNFNCYCSEDFCNKECDQIDRVGSEGLFEYHVGFGDKFVKYKTGNCLDGQEDGGSVEITTSSSNKSSGITPSTSAIKGGSSESSNSSNGRNNGGGGNTGLHHASAVINGLWLWFIFAITTMLPLQ